MRAAYEQAGWEPSDVDLIECHATGTPVGDAVEFASLRALWGDSAGRPGGCVIGSVKSNVGHALTAAGAAGLLKVLLALKHGVLPPTAGFDRPAPGLDIENSPFRILARSEPWNRRAEGEPRRVGAERVRVRRDQCPCPDRGVGAERRTRSRRSDRRRIDGSSPVELALPGRRDTAEPIAIVGLAAHFGPFEGLRAFQERVLGGSIAGEPTGPKNWWGADPPGSAGDGPRSPIGSTRSPCRPTGSASRLASWRRCSRSSRCSSGWPPRRSPTRAGTTGLACGAGASSGSGST